MLTSLDDVDLGGLVSSSDLPPPESADESQDYPAQESTDSLDTVYPPDTASMGSPLHRSQGENGTFFISTLLLPSWGELTILLSHRLYTTMLQLLITHSPQLFNHLCISTSTRRFANA